MFKISCYNFLCSYCMEVLEILSDMFLFSVWK